jgi:D-inositol-3-phosphate glycosyltransferase
MSSKNQKTVALISVHSDPALDIGNKETRGQNVYVREVGEALARLGWKVDMFTRRTSPEQAKIVEHTANCRTIRLNAGYQKFIKRQEIFQYLPDFVTAFLEFQAQQKISYNIIHTNYWLSACVGMELKKYQQFRHLHTYHSLGVVQYKSVKNIPEISQIRLKIEKKCLETADKIIAASPQEQEYLRSLLNPFSHSGNNAIYSTWERSDWNSRDTSCWDLSLRSFKSPVGYTRKAITSQKFSVSLLSTKDNIEVIPFGTDVTPFSSCTRLASRNRLNINLEAKVILYVGRFDRRKGIETLVRAVGCNQVRQHPDLKLIIVGGSTPGRKNGKERERIEDIVNELGLAEITTFAGHIEHQDLPDYYAAADVCVVPSHYEPFGLVAIEAMASGTPVIASNVGGLKFTVINELTGLLVPPQDKQAFAQAINQVLSYPAWSRQLEKEARKRVESKFSWDGVAEQLEQQYLAELDKLQQKSLVAAV